MSKAAFESVALTRIADFARTLTQLHVASRDQFVDDDQLDRAFNAVCMSLWGYTIEDLLDDMLSPDDHAFLDGLDEHRARLFAAENGYDLLGDDGVLSDWWGYCWMVLAEKRGLLTPENRATARLDWENKFRAVPNVIGVIVSR
ncbi:MAG: hypothetical protein K2W78_11380 [Xanthobacteraceae bacterium]|nr:hypothetical protein [Xanthobacteraceae bacterium]